MFIPTPFEEHLDTNYVPPGSEVPHIRILIQENKDALPQLEAQIQALEAVRTARLSFIHRHAALLSPIKRLPDDLLCTLFLAALGHPSDSSMKMSNKHPAVVLTHVCARWRYLALDTPRLWSSLTIHPPAPLNYGLFVGNSWTTDDSNSLRSAQLENPRIEVALRWEKELDSIIRMVGIWLQRSKGCDLSIRLQASDPGPQAAMQLPTTVLASLVDLLCNSSSRWEEATFMLKYVCSEIIHSSFRRIFELKAEDVPRVRRLNLTTSFVMMPSRCDMEGLPPPPNQNTGLLGAPQLLCLSLGGIFADLNTLPVRWGQLTNLRFDGYIDFFLPTKVFGCVEALALLRLCPQLVTCNLDLAPNPPTDVDLGRPVALVHLKSLTLRYSIPDQDFISRLSLPSLKSLSLLNYLHPIATRASHAMEAWLQTFGHQLTDLRVTVKNFTQTGLVRSMDLLPNIVSLKFDHPGGSPYSIKPHPNAPEEKEPAIIDREFLRRLTPPSGEDNEEGATSKKPVWCPKLEEIELLTFGGEEELIQFIARRRKLKTSLARLRKVTVQFKTLQEIDIARALWDDGVDTSGLTLKMTYPPRVSLRSKRSYSSSEDDFE
ncbi:hypothetical protein DFP72DRAFT_1130639 [Ephemerocybe angulata]|uniref:F-box domain-containing protein n=1 Tax=Ephemerocybe angulata TaxID=980116 RepID=A0A8H6HWQ2_9AGAR|nr:hypothetical protein DFP72DRAFT_1130639 [Tulosesus angulatus]